MLIVIGKSCVTAIDALSQSSQISRHTFAVFVDSSFTVFICTRRLGLDDRVHALGPVLVVQDDLIVAPLAEDVDPELNTPGDFFLTGKRRIAF